MLDDKLQELIEYIEDIEKKDPYEFLVSEIKGYIEIEDSVTQKELGARCYNDIISIINRYEGEADPDIIIKILFNIFIDFVKQKAVESKALSLGIEPSLYKKQMGFLFKGRKL